MIASPAWLGTYARDEFERNARFMEEINAAAGYEFFDQTDVATLAKMAASHQKSMEYMKAEIEAQNPEEADRAQRKRLAEDKNYQSFMKLLGLDPQGRADLRRRFGGNAPRTKPRR